MAARKPLFMSTEGYSEEMALTDTITLGGLTMGGNIDMQTVNTIVNVPNPTTDFQVANKAYVDMKAITGGEVKEVLLDANQLDDTDGINAAELLYFANQPAAGDIVTIKNGVLTRIYTFVANIVAEVAPTDVSIQTSDITAMQRFVLRANADAGNTQWDLVFRADEDDRINVNGVIVVYERASAAGASSSRIYGVWATPANGKVVEYASGATPTVAIDYNGTTVINIPAADPGAGRFGLRRIKTALIDGEIHASLSDHQLHFWDQDYNSGVGHWQTLSGPASIPDATSASGGGIKGKVTFDSDLGLNVTAGVASVKIDASTITFNGSGQLQALAASATSAQRVENSINVDEAVTAGDPLYITATGDRVGRADTSPDAKARVIGIARTTQGTIGNATAVVSAGPCAGILTLATPGTAYYLNTTGGLNTTLPGGGKRVVQCGIALNATDLFTRIVDYGKRAT